MGNLDESLGRDYVRQMCVGAIIPIGSDEVHLLRDVEEDGYRTKVLHLAATKPRWKSAKLPFDKLTSLADFSYPKLGYRVLSSPGQGPVVVSLATRRSAMRGLRLEQIGVEYLPVYYTLVPQFYEAWHEIREEQQIEAIFRPKFHGLAEGVKSMLNGDALAFAVSEDIAVMLAHNADTNRIADIFFKNKIVGSVDVDGTVSLYNKILQRDSLRRKLAI